LPGELVIGLADIGDVGPADGAGHLVLLVGAVLGLPLGPEVGDRDGGAVLPHGVGVVLHRDDLRVLAGELGRFDVVGVDGDHAVLVGLDAALDGAPEGTANPGQVHQGAVGVAG